MDESSGILCEVRSDDDGEDVDIVSDGGVDEDDDTDMDDMMLIMDDANF